jgi:hypothetical protein
LKLKTSALDELELPIAVQYGLLEKLYLKIPILSLGSEPVIVHLSGLYIVAGPKHRDSMSDAEERDRLERTKKRRLQLADLLGLDQTEEELDEETKLKRRKKAEEENDSVFGKLKMKILNNIQVKVENIHIRYQDDLSNPENPFALGITLDELYAESADENWTPGWIKSSKSTIIRKLARLQNLCIYFDTLSKDAALHSHASGGGGGGGGVAVAQGPPVAPMLRGPAVGPQSPADALALASTSSRDPLKKQASDIILKFANDQQMCKVLAELTYKKSRPQQPPHNYVLSPFSATIKLVLDISEDMANFTRPKVQVDATVPDIQLAINQAQFFGALDLFQYFSLYINSLQYLSLRPAQLNDKTLLLPENRSKLARLRWTYVLACVRSDVRKKVDSWSWTNIMQRKKDRITYTELFKKMKLDKKLRTSEEEQLTVLEKILEYDDIIVYRKLAYASILRDKRKKKRKKISGTSDPKTSRSSTPNVAPPVEDKKDKKSLKSSKEAKKEEEGSLLDRIFGLKKSDKEKARDKERAKEKEMEDKSKKAQEKEKLKTTVAASSSIGAAVASSAKPSPATTPTKPSPAAPSVNLEEVDENELLKELYESIGFDTTQKAEHSDYPKDYVHTKLSFHVIQGRVHLAEENPKLPVVGTFSFSNVYTGIRLSGVSSLQLDGYVETCEMFEYHTLGSVNKPYPVIQRDAMISGVTSSSQHILSFTVGTNVPSPASQSTDPVDLDLSVLALPLLITVSRPFIDRLLVFFDLYGRDDISEHLSELAQKSFDSIKQRAEAKVKYALGSRSTLLVNAIVHAPRIQVPSDYKDPLSSMALLDLGIISVMADTTARPDSKAALAKIQQMRESSKQLTASGSEVPVSIPIDESYFYDRIMMKLTGITAGVVKKRSEGLPQRPPPKDSPDIIALLSKINTVIQLSICNAASPDLARARVDATVSQIKVQTTKDILAIAFDVVKTGVKDTRPRDPIREAELAEKARLRRLQLILWSEELGDDAPALHALLNGMESVNRRRQNLAAFLDFDDSETETDSTTDTETELSESEDPFLDSSSRSIASHGSSSSLHQVKERLRNPKARPPKQRFELKLFEAHFKLDGIAVVLAETLNQVTYPIVTFNLDRVTAQLNLSDQSIVLQTSLQAFAIQEHITERTTFGESLPKGNEYFIVRSLSPPDMALISIRYEQLDRRCNRYNDVDHNVKVMMQGIEVTVSRLTIASLIVVLTELTTSLQQAMGLMTAGSSVITLSSAQSGDENSGTTAINSGTTSTETRLIAAPGPDDAIGVGSDSESELSEAEAVSLSSESVEDIQKRESRKAAQLAMAKALAQEGIVLAAIELSLKEVVVQLSKEGSPFFKVSLADAHTKVGIYPDHTTSVHGSLSDLRCSARTNEQGTPLWTLTRASAPVSAFSTSSASPIAPRVNPDAQSKLTTEAPPAAFSKTMPSAHGQASGVTGSNPLTTSGTTPRIPHAWTDIIYVEGGTFGSFSLKVYDPSMPNFPGHDMEVDAAVGGLRVVVLFRVVDEIITYLTAFTSMLGVIGYLQAAKSTDEPEPKTKLNVKVSSPIIYIPRNSESREYVCLSLGATTVANRLDTIAGIKYDFMTVNIKGLNLRAIVANLERTDVVERFLIDHLDLSLAVNRAIEGNQDHLLPDVEISSTIEQIKISIAAADLDLLVGLLAGNFSEFVLRKDEVELQEAVAFLERINLVQFISNLVPLSTVTNLSTIPFVKVRVSFSILAVLATLYRSAGVLIDGGDSALLNAKVSSLDMNILVTSDEGIQLGLNVERIEVLDCSANTPNKFRYVLLPNLGFAQSQASTPSTPSPSPRPASVRFSRTSSVSSSSSSLVRSMGSATAPRPPPFFKLRYEDRPTEAIEFVTVTLLHPRVYIVPNVVQELVGILLPVIGSLTSALDTWHQRLLFGSESEQRDVLADAIASLESRHRDELLQLVTQHRNELSSIRLNKNSTPKDEEDMKQHQERDRNSMLARQKQELIDLKLNGIVPKWTNPNEMRVKVEIENPEICILERSDTITSASFVISLGHVILRLSLLPDKISVEPNVCDFGIFKAMLDSTDITGTLDKILLLQPFDVNGSILVRPPTPKTPGSLVDILLRIGLIHTIVSYRDVRLGVEVYRSFEPMIDKVLKLVEELGAAAAEAAKLRQLSKPQDELVLQLDLKKMLFSLLNDHNPQFVVPVAKVTLDHIMALVQTNENLNITLNLPSIAAEGFNNSLSSYEPLIEPWGLDVKVLERNKVMNIPISAEQKPLNVNVTKSLFDAIFGIIGFVDDMKAILSPGDNVRILKIGAPAGSPAGAQSSSSAKLHLSSRSSGSTGVIQQSPTPSSSGHSHKPSATLSIHQIAALGEMPASSTPTGGSIPTSPATGALSHSGASTPVPGQVSKTLSSNVGAERSFDPFLVRNDTNEHIRVWKSNESTESSFVLQPGEQMSLRSQKASKHAADTTFYVNVDITIGSSILALERIPIEKVHTQIYSLNSDRNVKILSEVTLQHGTKILTLSTVHYIRNETSELLEVEVVNGSNSVHAMFIPSHQTRSLPIAFCYYKEIRMRPTGGYNWYTRVDKSADAILNCTSSDATSNRSWSCCLSYSSRTLEGGKDYCIKLSPQLILENLMCSPLLLKTSTPTVKVFAPFTAMTSYFGAGSKSKQVVGVGASSSSAQDELETGARELAFDIEVGDQLPVFAAQAASSVLDQSYRVQIPGYDWSEPINMRELFSKARPGMSFERAVNVKDVADRSVTIYALIYPPSVGSMRVSFFSKYWLINQTGLCLSFRTNSKSKPLIDDPRSINLTGNPRTWYKGDFMSERAAQKTYYSTGEISLQVLGASAAQSSPWSSTYTLEQKEEDQVQQTKIETVNIADAKAHRFYSFKMEITTAPGKHWRTKEIRLTPAYILINKTDTTIYYDQFKGSDQRTSTTCFDLLPGERVPFHWPSSRTSGKRFIFTTKEAYTSNADPMNACWSFPFKLSALDSFIFKIRPGPSGASVPGTQDQLILVQIIERKNVFCVVFRNSPQDTIPFYKIDNRTNADVFVEQEGVKGSRERVPPRSLQNWFWDNPLLEPSKRMLMVCVADPYGSKSLSDTYKVQLDRSIVPRDEREAREGRATMDLPNWDFKFRSPNGVPLKVRVRLIQQGFVKILRLETPQTAPARMTLAPHRGAAAATTSLASSSDSTPMMDDAGDMFAPEETRIELELRLCGIGISLIDHFRAKNPTELVYATFLGISMNLVSCKNVHRVNLNINKLQVDNQIKFSPEPVLLTSVRAPLRGAKRASDVAPFLMTTVEIDTSEQNLVYVREMALELQVLDLAADQQFILSMAGFGEGLAKYIATQSGHEQSVLTPETTLPTIEDAELVSPNFFVQALKIYPVKLVLSLTKGHRTEAVANTSNSETLIKKITDPILGFGSVNRTTVQLGVFELMRVGASFADLGVRVAEHYRDQAFTNIAKVLFNYLNIIKLFSSDPPPRAPIRLPRYFPADHLVIPYDTAKAYGQNLLVTLVNGKYSSETYLFHVWLGASVKPLVLICTTKHIALIDASVGVSWAEATEAFVGVQIIRPTRAKDSNGNAQLFFDKFDATDRDANNFKRTFEGLTIEQLLAIEKSFRAISQGRRSTATTVSVLSSSLQTLASSD